MKIANLTPQKFFSVNLKALILVSAMTFSLYAQAQLVNIATGTTVTVVSGTNMVVTGGISFQAGTSAMSNDGTVKLTGDWTNDGNGLTGGTGTVECNGTSNQNLTGANSTSFYNLTVNNAAGVTLGKDQSVSNTLTFASGSGSLTTGSNKLTVTSTGNAIAGADASRYVNGNLQKDFVVSGGLQSFIYEMGDAVYAPATLDIRNVNGSAVSVVGYTTPTDANENVPTVNASGIDQSAKANRYWIMTKSGGAFDDYDLTLDFTNCSPTGNPAAYVVRKFDPSTWMGTTATSTPPTIKATGLTSFSDFETGVPIGGTLSLNCAHTNVSCNGGSDGTASVTSLNNSVGTAYYLWSNGQTTPSATGLTTGTYTVTVTDNFYSATCSQTVDEPAVLTLSASSNTPICANDNLNLSSSVSGGTTTYNYLWSGPNGFSSTVANPTFNASSSTYSGDYYVTVTDANSCSSATSTSVTVNNCVTTVNLKLYLESYYVGSGFMRPAIKNQQANPDPLKTDSIFVLLHNTTAPYAMTDSVFAFLYTNGTASAIFPPTLAGNSRYIEIKQRNNIQTWSAAPVSLTTTTSYDFSTGAGQAYASNQIQVDNSLNLYGLYSGNLNQDFNIDLIDFPILDFGINNGLFGYYRSDLNGDGNTDIIDFPVLDSNINAGIFSKRP